MTRPPDPALRVSSAFLALLTLTALPLFTTAQQQHISKSHTDVAASASYTPSLHQQQQRQQQQEWPAYEASRHQPGRNANQKNKNKNHNTPQNQNEAFVSTDVRALATRAPRGLDRVVRAHPARPAAPSAGLSSRLPARSLQDWVVEDIVLLATVDGKIHARDRRTGESRWNLESESPMVQTIYYQQNASHEEDVSSDSADAMGYYDFLFIVEPSQDGALYTYAAGDKAGIRRMDLTVKQLADESPHRSIDPPVVYTAEKKSTLYIIDVSSGHVLQDFNPTPAAMDRRRSPPPPTGLGDPPNDKCMRTLTLARTEYIVTVQREDMTPICTIKFFEWGPNKRDEDLQLQHSAATTVDRQLYGLYDGRILALDPSPGVPTNAKPTFQAKLESPVARVFDVARPREADDAAKTPMILLTQPGAQVRHEDAAEDLQSRVFVNCTESGGWYALSEATYPGVTEEANPAQCALQKEWASHQFSSILKSNSDQLRQALVGVHSLSAADLGSGNYLELDGPGSSYGVDGPDEIPLIDPADSSKWTWNLSIRLEYTLLVAVLALGAFFTRRNLWPDAARNVATAGLPKALPVEANLSGTATPLQPIGSDDTPIKQAIKSVKFSDEYPPIDDTDVEDVFDPASVPLPDDDEAEGDPSLLTDQEGTPKAGKARRGKRGGRKQKKTTKQGNGSVDVQESLMEAVKQDQQGTVLVQPDATNNDLGDGKLGLQNLIIHVSDLPLGSGSGGTFVFKGEFEGREVAVKRMLPQYFELMSQEVAMLEQSEDHPNVIRYFCRRQDSNFLYIALELCQASLYDLFKDGRGDEIDRKFYDVRAEIVRDPGAVLRQLAEGLRYLHSFRIVHRDIKPQNMLIAFPKKNSATTFPRLVISDFGLCKTLPDNVSTLIGTTGNAGTAGWKAPELIFQPREMNGNGGSQASTSKDSTNGDITPAMATSLGVKRAIDIFSMGCVFFYVFTQGKHPYDDEEGWMQLRERNIKTNKANFSPLSFYTETAPDIVDLIHRMLAAEPERRPTAAQVLAHPFFWSAEDRLDFLTVASDRYDQEPRDPPSAALEQLERHADDIIPWNTTRTTMSGGFGHSSSSSFSSSFQSASAAMSYASPAASAVALQVPERNFLLRLDAKFVATLGKQRKYKGDRVVDLLRALRNKHHHWDDMPDDVKRKVGEVPEGYLAYWEERFVGLVLHVWMAVKEAGWERERRFKRFFAD